MRRTTSRPDPHAFSECRHRATIPPPTSWKLAWLVKCRPDPSESINRANRGYIIFKVGREQTALAPIDPLYEA